MNVILIHLYLKQLLKQKMLQAFSGLLLATKLALPSMVLYTFFGTT